VAIYHLSVKAVSRSAGRSVVAAAAYRSGVALTDERQGIDHDYTRRQGVVAAFIVAPAGADWAHDRNALWNAAEAAEKRKDAKTGREYELALPAELDAVAREELARSFAAEVVRRYGVAADVAIHEPGREGDNRNYHAHILTTTRTVEASGMGVKTRSLDVSSTASAEIEQLREVWAHQVNSALERDQVAQRVDHRSFTRQGKEQEPTVHMGVSATAMERKAACKNPGSEAVTDLGRKNAEIRKSNQVLDLAGKAMERSQEIFSSLEKRAKLAVGFARKIGKRTRQLREEQNRWLELTRQIESKRQKDIQLAREAKKANEQNKQLSQDKKPVYLPKRGFSPGF